MELVKLVGAVRDEKLAEKFLKKRYILKGFNRPSTYIPLPIILRQAINLHNFWRIS